MSLSFAKGAAQLLAGLGVGRVVGEVIRNNTTVTTLYDKILINAGSLVIGSMAVEAASKHVERQIDMWAAWYNKSRDEIETSKEEE